MTGPVVMHLIEHLGVGGAETMVRNLAVRLKGSNVVPVVCCLRGGPLMVQLEEEGVDVVSLGISRRSIVLLPLFVLDIARILFRLKALVRARGVDLIHAHQPDCAIIGGVAALLTRRKLVVTYHGLTMLAPARWRHDPRNYLRLLFYRLADRLAARSVAVSGAVRSMLEEQFGFDPRKITVVYNGIDCARFRERVDRRAVLGELGLHGREPVITCVGRLAPNKGQALLVRAAALVRAARPGVAVLLVGDGPAKDDLVELVRGLGLGEVVAFAGQRFDVERILAVSDVFVLASDAEGIPLALLEAMASETAVVATAVPGNVEVVDDEDTGLLVRPSDPEALAEALLRLLGDRALRERLGARGAMHARERFDLAAMTARTVELYEEVLLGRDAGTP